MPNYSDPTLTVSSTAAIIPARVTIGQILVLVAGIVALLLAAFMYWQTLSLVSLAVVETAKDAEIKSKIGLLQPSISQLSDYNAVGNGLKQLFDTQKLWPASLANVEQHLYRHMALTNMQIDSKGTVTLSGTTPSYTDYAHIYSSLTDSSVSQYFTNVRPSAVSKSATTGVVTFSFTFTLSPSQLVSASAQ